MYLMYIDESGDTISLSQGGKKFLILTGCIVAEKNKISIEKQFRDIKQKYYQDPENVFEYNKKKGEYWRFSELTLPKLYKSSAGKLIGYGLKLFP